MKFKVGDKVTVYRVVYLNKSPQWEDLVGRNFIITEVIKWKGTENSYSLVDLDNGNEYAWIWESQLKELTDESHFEYIINNQPELKKFLEDDVNTEYDDDKVECASPDYKAEYYHHLEEISKLSLLVDVLLAHIRRNN